MKKLLILSLLILSTSAFAVGIGNDNPPSNGGNTSVIVDARPNSYSASQASNNTTVVSTPSLTATNAATASVGASTVNLQGGDVSFNHTERTGRNTPAFALGNVYPTSPCMGSTTVGGSGVGFGIGIGLSWTDDECGIRETSRSFSGIGLKDDAVSILCTSKYAKETPTCKALTTSNTSIQE